MAWLALSELHRDPAIFVEHLVDAIREVLSEPLEEIPTFGDEVLRALPRSTAPSPDGVVDSLCRSLRTLTRPLILCLDAFEQLESGSVVLEIVDRLLRSRPAMLHLVVTTRGLTPSSLPRLLADGDVEIIDAFALSLRAEQVARVLADEGVDLSESELAQLLARTRGWAIAVRFAARALATAPPERRSEIVRRLDADEDLFRYIAGELIARATPELVRTLEIASLLGPIDRATLSEAIAADDARSSVDRALDSGLLQAASGQISVHELLAEWIRQRLRESRAPHALQELYSRLGELLERRGHAFEALRLYRLADRSEAISGLVARNGHDWVAEGHREIAAEALRSIPEATRNADPALVALQGLVASGLDPDSAIERLKTAIEMYRRAGNRRAEFEAFHQLSIVAMNENRMSEVMSVYRRALTLRRVVVDPALRGFLITALGLGSFVLGRHRLALRLLATADTYELHPRERGGIGLVRSLILFLQGDWDRVVAEVDDRCRDERQRTHGTTYYGMQTYRAAVLGLRGLDLASCRVALDDAIRLFSACRHSLVTARAHLIAGHLATRAGDRSAAIGHFTASASLCRRIRLHAGEAAALGCLARVQLDSGNLEGARESARSALSLLGSGERSSDRPNFPPYFALGCALAALVVAQTGDPEAARRFFDTHRRALQFDRLPLCSHGIGLLEASVHALAGSSQRAQTLLLEAERSRTRAGLRDFAPELDPEMLEWARQQARAGPSSSGAPDSAARADSDGSEGDPELRTLGGLDLIRNGRAIALREWKGATTRRLLVRLLVAEGRWLAREEIEADLWPESEPANARNNLRVALSRLRDTLEPRRQKGLPSRFIRVEGERLALGDALLQRWRVWGHREAARALDLATTEADAERAASALARLQRGAHLPFVPEIYDEWASTFGRERAADWSRIARRSASRWLANSRPELAESIAKLLLDGDRLDETAWALLVEARLASEDRSGAARALVEARDRLRSELGIEPGESLRRLARQLGLPGEGFA